MTGRRMTEDEDFSHRANRTTTAGARKTARRVLIAPHHKFVTHGPSQLLAHCAGCISALPTLGIRESSVPGGTHDD